MSKPANNNIVSFPTSSSLPYMPPKTVDEVKENLELIRQFHVQQTIELIIENLFSQVYLAGFPVNGDDVPSQREGAFITETLRAILLNMYKINHPFQKIIDSVFIEKDEDMLEIVDHIDVCLKEEDDTN